MLKNIKACATSTLRLGVFQWTSNDHTKIEKKRSGFCQSAQIDDKKSRINSYVMCVKIIEKNYIGFLHFKLYGVNIKLNKND